MKSFKDFRREALENPAVKAAYDALKEEYALARALIQARQASGLTQEELAQRMHTKQSTVARWESGKHLPSCQTLQRIARATNTDLRVSFVPHKAPKKAAARVWRCLNQLHLVAPNGQGPFFLAIVVGGDAAMLTAREMRGWIVLGLVLFWATLAWTLYSQPIWWPGSSPQETLHQLQCTAMPLDWSRLVGMGYGSALLTRMAYCVLRAPRDSGQNDWVGEKHAWQSASSWALPLAWWA
jgi:transcriptional regulator with XRE-family HTH domain